MTTVIRQIVGNQDQTIRQVVTSNDRGQKGDKGDAGGTIEYTAGAGITISPDNVISATGKTSVAWGNIDGNLSDQTDLQTALNAKANTSDLATVATSGSYNDLTNKPSLATVATSGSYNDLTNKPNLATVATSGSYTDLNNKPTTLDFINIVYPVGSYYETSDTTFNPNVSWGGTWTEDTAGRVLVAMDAGTFSTVGNTGGEETHTLTTAEMPSHSHINLYDFNGAAIGTDSGAVGVAHIPSGGYGYGSVTTGTAGSGGSHNNLQPYIVIKRWHRTA